MDRSRRRRTRGFSLVSQMVGLLLSTLVMLSLLAVFRVSAQATTDVRLGASGDEQLAAALPRALVLLQDAGYGAASPAYGTHLVVLSGATLSGSTLAGTAVAAGAAGNAVVWAADAGGGMRCTGLWFDPATTGTGGLKQLGPVACASAAAWNALAWTSAPWVASPAARPLPAVGFTAVAGACSPFGLQALAAQMRIVVTAATAAGAPVAAPQCLVNFRT